MTGSTPQDTNAFSFKVVPDKKNYTKIEINGYALTYEPVEIHDIYDNKIGEGVAYSTYQLNLQKEELGAFHMSIRITFYKAQTIPSDTKEKLRVNSLRCAMTIPGKNYLKKNGDPHMELVCGDKFYVGVNVCIKHQENGKLDGTADEQNLHGFLDLSSSLQEDGKKHTRYFGETYQIDIKNTWGKRYNEH